MNTGKKVNNALYKATIEVGANRLIQILWYATNIFFFKNPVNVSKGLKIFLLKLFGAKVGSGVVIKPSVNIKYPWKLEIGNHSWIGEGVWIDNLSLVKIGDNVTISQGAMILTGSHDYTKEAFDFISKPVLIENEVWIGAKAIVYGGITCYTHAILGINSVAETNLASYVIYKGNPAVPIIKRIIN